MSARTRILTSALAAVAALAAATAAATLAGPAVAAPAGSAAGSAAGPAAGPVPAMTPAPPLFIRNGSFEDGKVNWSCEDARVSSPGHWGQRSLEGVTSANSTGRCTQTIAVRPNFRYTLSAWVQGSWVHLGVTGYGSPATVRDATTWTNVSTTFTTPPGTETVEVYVSGWYAQGRYRADDVAVGGAVPSVPAAPGGVTVDRVTSRFVTLSWQPAARAASYAVVDGNHRLVAVSPGPGTTTRVGVSPDREETLRVIATNPTGSSPASAPVTVTVPADEDSVPWPPYSLEVTPGPAGSLWLAWDAVLTARQGYAVYVDGVRVRRVYSPAWQLDGLAPDRTYRIEITAINEHGESDRSAPGWGTTLPEAG